ncbi:MAG: response regulator [Treponema sp.]|jgi:signal transduction histidine kinase/CheY-like chemotaxis protein|nr:response regulator [Treponema sp.]
MAVIKRYAQAVAVLLAFALMVIFSYSFVSKAERVNLQDKAREAIFYTEANIKAELKEPETLLAGVAETIRGMIIAGNTVNNVQEYIYHINSYVRAESDKRMFGVIGFYAVLDVFGGKFIAGSNGKNPDGNFDSSEQTWYTAAVNADGEIATTQPYVDAISGNVSLTFARRIFDDDGSPLGIIALGIHLDKIKQYAIDTRFTKDGYGFLMDENTQIIAHQEPSLLGMILLDIKSGIAAYSGELQKKGSVSGAVTRDYRGVESIVFLQRLYNGWYMGVVTPKDNYYQSTRNLAIILSVLGVIFAAFLGGMLLRISALKAASDERMQLMSDSNPIAMSFLDKNFHIIDCNQTTLDMFGLSSKKEYFEKFYTFSPERQPDGSYSKEKSIEVIKSAMETGFNHFEWEHKKPDGEPIPCEITLIRTRYKNDFIIISYARDLREQKRIIKMIEQRTHLLDMVNSAATILLSSNNAGSFETSMIRSFELIGRCLDVDRVQIWRNEMVEDELHFVLRYEWLSEYGEKCKGVPMGLHFPYSMKKEWEALFLRGEHINMPLRDMPEEDQAFLGYYEMKSIVIIPMFLEGGFWGFFSIDDCRNERTFSTEEISILTSAGLMMSSAVNRNIQMNKMREADERTQIMIDAAPLCILFWDKNLDLIDCNQETAKMFELSSKYEFIEKFIMLSPEYQPDGNPSKDKGIALVTKALEEGYSNFEWMHQKLNGEQIPVDVYCIRVKYKDEYTVIEYMRDLSEQKAKIAETRKAEIAEESSKAKSNFLAKMSHEIRTPMNAILGITEIQLQDNTLLEPVKEAFERIYNSGDLLLGIINDILDLSKIEAGKLELALAQYDIASLINDTVQLNIMRYESKPIEFILEIDEDVPLVLLGDELRIKQILNNILSNAFKYTDEGTVSMTVASEQSYGDNITIVFTVTDTGQGMTKEQLSSLGTEYSRFNMEANRRTEGTGLGMNITMNLIRLMNGSISIDSTPGEGSVFIVRLPQKLLDSETIGKELAENLMHHNLDGASRVRTIQVKRDFMPYGRVLVVDDVETNLYVAKGLMSPYGLSIDVSMSGFEAIERVRSGSKYDIIFMDHMMPRMDGIEAAKIIRNLGYKEPIVALTANALAGQAEMFFNNGFDGYISKPIDIRQLNATLNKLVRDKQPAAVIEEARRQKESLSNAIQYSSFSRQLIEFFLRDAKKSASILETIYVNKGRRSDDLSIFIINIHGMKSALANIGKEELSDYAARLEQAGRDKNIKYILSELPSFLELLYDLINKLESENAAEKEAVSDDDSSHKFLKEKLLGIRSSCAIYNKKAAKYLLMEIKEKTWPPSTTELLNKISENLLHSEFDEIVKSIDDFVKQS